MPIMKKRIMLKLHYGSIMCTIIIVFEDISVYSFIKMLYLYQLRCLFLHLTISILVFFCGAVISLNVVIKGGWWL